jgi:multiple antibiotic resistance protein
LWVTFLVLLIGIGPKIALVPFLEITASLDPAAKQCVVRKMMTTAATVAVVQKVFGFLIAAIAVQLVLDGLASVGVIGPVPH